MKMRDTCKFVDRMVNMIFYSTVQSNILDPILHLFTPIDLLYVYIHAYIYIYKYKSKIHNTHVHETTKAARSGAWLWQHLQPLSRAQPGIPACAS